MAIAPDYSNTHSEVARPVTNQTGPCPPAFLEYAWYASLAYASLGAAWGIVIPAVGGAILVLLAAACLLSVGDQVIRLCRPNIWAFYTGITVLLVQLMFHDLTDRAMPEVIAFVGWLAVLIIVQALSLRSNFLHRFALAALAIGVASLPFINVRNVGGVMRAWASGTGISNPNVLGMWFGFCSVYFLFWGFRVKNHYVSAASWAVAVGCFYVVTLTVSRAPLLGIILACAVGFRAELKRSFVPIVSLALLLCLVYVSGAFDEELGYYASRGAEESGRGKLWPAALERIMNSPWVGVGLDDVRIRMRSGNFKNPHNPLLHIALGAGIVPVICYLGYMGQILLGVRRVMQRVQVGEAALLPPLVVFGLFDTMTLDMAFMSPWAVVVFSLAAMATQNRKYRAER